MGGGELAPPITATELVQRKINNTINPNATNRNTEPSPRIRGGWGIDVDVIWLSPQIHAQLLKLRMKNDTGAAGHSKPCCACVKTTSYF